MIVFGRTVLSAVAAIVIASPAVSQQHQHGRADSTTPPQQMMDQMGMMSMMDNPFMMRVMRFAPQNVVAHAETLNLDDMQRTHLQEIQASMQPHEQMANMQNAMQALQEAFDADSPDLDAIRAAAAALAPMCTTMQAQHLTAAARVRALLTPSQREQLMLLPLSGMGMGMGRMMMNQ